MMRTISALAKRSCPSNAVLRSRPSTYSIAMNEVPSSSSKS